MSQNDQQNPTENADVLGTHDAVNPPTPETTQSPTVGAALEEAMRAVEEQRDKYLRLAAEYENFRKRAQKDRLEAGTRAQGELVAGLVEMLDDIARFAHVDPNVTDAKTVVDGVAMVEKKALKALGEKGLEIVFPLDLPFDPTKHEAVGTEPAASAEQDHLVAKVYQSGYLFRGQLLRPARVVVRQWNG